MPTPNSLPRLAACALLGGVSRAAQSVPAPGPTADAIVLSPFTVQSERTDGYEATNTNSLIGTETSLKNVPISADVMNRQFFDDLALTNSAAALRFFSAGIGSPVRGAGNKLSSPIRVPATSEVELVPRQEEKVRQKECRRDAVERFEGKVTEFESTQSHAPR